MPCHTRAFLSTARMCAPLTIAVRAPPHSHTLRLCSLARALHGSYGSLPQKPRSPAEETTFRTALKVMADLCKSQQI